MCQHVSAPNCLGYSCKINTSKRGNFVSLVRINIPDDFAQSAKFRDNSLNKYLAIY